jgi:hypothetical protein
LPASPRERVPFLSGKGVRMITESTAFLLERTRYLDAEELHDRRAVLRELPRRAPLLGLGHRGRRALQRARTRHELLQRLQRCALGHLHRGCVADAHRRGRRGLRGVMSISAVTEREKCRGGGPHGAHHTAVYKPGGPRGAVGVGVRVRWLILEGLAARAGAPLRDTEE